MSDCYNINQCKSRCKCNTEIIKIICQTGAMGLPGQDGKEGAMGLPGLNAIVNFSNFYALMPSDNTSTITAGASVLFPNNGIINGDIVRINAYQFNLPTIGIYEILFQVSISEAGQLVINLNNIEISNTIFGRATGTTEIVGMALINTTIINSILSINNPVGNPTALTITPIAGGTRPVSAQLIIKQLA